MWNEPFRVFASANVKIKNKKKKVYFNIRINLFLFYTLTFISECITSNYLFYTTFY